MKRLYLLTLFLSSCATRHYNPVSEKWIVTEKKGPRFKVEGKKGWFRSSRGDTSIHKGDTLYINYPGHEEGSTVGKWRVL